MRCVSYNAIEETRAVVFECPGCPGVLCDPLDEVWTVLICPRCGQLWLDQTLMSPLLRAMEEGTLARLTLRLLIPLE